MCGIAGIVSPAGFPTDLLPCMSHALQHRGPDDEGYWVMDLRHRHAHFTGKHSAIPGEPLPQWHAYAALIHRRLSILDLSEAGHQPMASSDGQCILAYNGEVYNYRELRPELERLGYIFLSNTDTEVVLNALRAWGTDAFTRFRGMWALAFVDLGLGELWLARDPLGIKPLYLSRYVGGRVFASEMKAFFALPGFDRTVNRNELISYIAHGATSHPQASLFEQIEDLAPGTLVRLNLQTGKEARENYPSPYDSQLQDLPTDPRGWLSRFEAAFHDSVRLHMRSDAPLGTCLSGGLDSSAIAAVGTRIWNRKLDAVTATFPGHAADEAHYARLVVDSLGEGIGAHYLISPDVQSLWENFDSIARTHEVPFASSSILVQYAVMQEAAHAGLKVVVNGQGSDELLGGYYHMAAIHVLDGLRGGRMLKAWRLLRDLQQNFTPGMPRHIARSAYYSLPPTLQRLVRSRYRKGPGLLAGGATSNFAQLGIPQRGGKNFNEVRRQAVHVGLYELLRYEDRNSMAWSVESRVPFLDPEFVKVVMAMPADILLRGGYTKFPLRHLLQGMVPHEVAWRKDKLGFVAPQQQWLANLLPQIKPWVQRATIPPVLDAQKVQALFQQPQSDPALLSEQWRMLSILKWWQTWELKDLTE